MCCLNRSSWFTCVRRTNEVHTFFIIDLIQLYCLRLVSNNQTQPDIGQTAYVNAWYNTIKPHVQTFLKMNTWLFETCRRQYNWIISLMKKKCAIRWLCLHTKVKLLKQTPPYDTGKICKAKTTWLKQCTILDLHEDDTNVSKHVAVIIL